VLILSHAQISTVTINTPWGAEQAICFHGKTFLPTQKFNNLAAAIAVCRKDLDSGLFSIVVEEPDQVGVWCPIPAQMHTTDRVNHVSMPWS
jgi:hypothetical protein